MMDQQNEELKPPLEGKPFLNWTNKENESFGEAFSLQDFSYRSPQKEGEEGYIQVRVPASVEPMLTGAIAAERKIGSAIGSPLDATSQKTMKQFVGDTVNATGMAEEEEAKWIQELGQFIEVADLVGDKPDAA